MAVGTSDYVGQGPKALGRVGSFLFSPVQKSLVVAALALPGVGKVGCCPAGLRPDFWPLQVWAGPPPSPVSPFASHSFFLRLCSEVPILEDTLMRILVVGLSRELPLGPADAMELADHLVKRAAAVQADGNAPWTVLWALSWAFIGDSPRTALLLHSAKASVGGVPVHTAGPCSSESAPPGDTVFQWVAHPLGQAALLSKDGPGSPGPAAMP